MVAYNKFENAVEDILNGVHDFRAAGDQVAIYLSNTTPNPATQTVKANLAEITPGNGYTGPVDTQNAVSRTGGTVTVSAVDVVITASGGPIAQFQHVVLFNDTPTSPADPLIAWWDRGSPVDMVDGETFTVDFGSDQLFSLS